MLVVKLQVSTHMPATFAPIAALLNDLTSKSLPLRGTDMTVVVMHPRVPYTAVGGNLLHLPPIPRRAFLVPVCCFLLARQLNAVNVSTRAAKFTAVAGSNAEHLAAGWQLHGRCRQPAGLAPSMQEVLLALDPDFLDRLAAAPGHGAMLAKASHRANSHLRISPPSQRRAASESALLFFMSMGAAGSPLTSLDALIRAFLLLRHRRRH